MKKIISFSLIVALLFVAQSPLFAQIRKVPAAVTEAFKKKYPSASNVEWKDKMTVFMAGFDLNNGKHEARFTSKGEWKNTEQEVGEAGLPEAVKDGFKKSKYSADWSIGTAYRIDSPGDKTEYRVHVVKNDIQKKNLLFSSEGRLLKENITL